MTAVGWGALTSQLLGGDTGELEGFVALGQGVAQVVVRIEQARSHMVERHLLPAANTHKKHMFMDHYVNFCRKQMSKMEEVLNRHYKISLIAFDCL